MIASTDNIESNVTNVEADTRLAVTELTAAHEYQRRAGRRMVCLMLLLVVVVTVVLLAVRHPPRSETYSSRLLTPLRDRFCPSSLGVLKRGSRIDSCIALIYPSPFYRPFASRAVAGSQLNPVLIGDLNDIDYSSYIVSEDPPRRSPSIETILVRRRKHDVRRSSAHFPGGPEQS